MIIYLIPKEDSKLMNFISKLMFWNPAFKTMTMVIGHKVYMPKSIIGTKLEKDILSHEAMHIKDFERFGVLIPLSYYILPAIVSGRAFWEWRAFKQDLLRWKKEKGTITKEDEDWVVRQFTGIDYFFMFPFPKFLRKKINKLRDDSYVYVEPSYTVHKA